jgi:integrase/recombinase XerD
MTDDDHRMQDHHSRRVSRFRGQDGVTQEERDLAPADDTTLRELERDAAIEPPRQPPLFEFDASGTAPEIASLPELNPHSSLALARSWYRRDLERARRPRNTIESYCYDLMVLEQLVGPKSLEDITRRDIARYLGDATSKATRKRRLTSGRRFFRFLIEERVLDRDPTEGYYPHSIELRLPLPLFAAEQASMLEAAREDEPWSAVAIWLMMRLGLTRSELLGLRRDHIDRSHPGAPVIYVYYPELTKSSKERSLVANQEFADLYDQFLADEDVTDELFPVGPPAVNGMVERVRKSAAITKAVTPQTLRHTFAVERARDGADQEQLLALLGLSDDPRNRASVDRYIKLAHAANEPAGNNPSR